MRLDDRPPPPIVAALVLAAASVLGAGACTAIAGIDDYAVGGGAGGSHGTGTTHGGPGCVPTTCEKLGAACGTMPDGCGGTLVCPTKCVAPETCGGAGVANQCGCTKTTCAAQGKDCGEIADGCGGTLPCGQCKPGETCGANQKPNVCGLGTCVTKTCAEQGVECGPAPLGNGCDGPLECPPCQGGLVCSGGACACPPAWTTALPGKVVSGRLVAVSNRVVAVGSEPALKQAWVAAVDHCTGAVAAERSFSPTQFGVTATTAELHDVTTSPSSGALLAVGAASHPNDPGEGILVELDPGTLASAAEVFLSGSTGVDAMNGVGEAPDGKLWMAGSATAGEGKLGGWLVTSSAHGADPCGMAGPVGSGPGQSVLMVPGAAHLVNVLFRDPEGQAEVASYDPDGCVCGSECTPGSLSKWDVAQVAPNGVQIFGAATVDALAYVVGAFCPLATPTDCSAFVRVVDLATGTLRPEQFTYDLGNTTEAFLGIAIDGDAVYVTGAQGLDLVAFGNGELSSAKGVVVRLRRSDLVNDWIAVVPSFDVGVGVVSDGPDALVVSGRTDAGSVVLRCSKALCQ